MPHSAYVAHEIDGRIRLKVPDAKKNPDLLETIRKALAGIPGAESVDANPLTGSVLLYYDPGLNGGFRQQIARSGEETGLFALMQSQTSDVAESAEGIRNEPEYFASPSKTAEVIINEIGNVNWQIKKVSGNTVDLNLLLPMGFALYSASLIAKRLATPRWLTLAIFSFNSFMSLNRTGNSARSGERTQAVQRGNMPLSV
jgi:hypothetical protein